MENQFTNQQQTSENIPMSMNHGAHEVMDVHEVLSASIGALNMFVMLRPHVQDPELLNILDRQYAFMLDEYNITAECFKTGQDPSHPTRKYCMQIGNDSKYGLTPSEPKKPITSANEIDDSIISGFMLSQHKALATGKTAAALEATNPVVRRVLQDSVPNCIEMAYELSLYQNKKGYYQVPQLSPQDMQTMLNMYGQADRAKDMPN
ncbi:MULTISPECIES: spore coat protein [Ureibacillus]|jgi:spore coat protein CotF|uniref:Spore coat protein CotF n=1 Tax=Ureibacillus thermosphaericus TaxID=51173 RepID=A0A840Q340_URETH|nr:spore coat protein [Ureibacillus thermosphaericus]MBB5149436.1 spore coat protein CotF [Ureibacillus thermosphaericus]NKZ32324.1 spore coat protein [Ureibacillus thermosphaericus]